MTTPLATRFARFTRGEIDHIIQRLPTVEAGDAWRDQVRVAARRAGFHVRTGRASADPRVCWALNTDHPAPELMEDS